ncbi:DUF485 domain-containing protein [Nakamurella flavida]|uniref:DUF485 domain-containing protein n=1 Tax=Nakamurella flavida TaxID=363630 RepID=A0A938YHA2_9ACTN|nr:DUF485 domain-containing protein [Nakamurella flavida]MBM9475059.1 DUF485 domain-containing protein [Nakamurella flavida]MDP9776628.1 uncharacterized membrane protein (DUF485 family) [Nakamurella flavida]
MAPPSSPPPESGGAHRPGSAGSDSPRSSPAVGPPWEELQDSAQFADLRRAVRSFIFPLTVAFLVWYLTYVLCAAYARGFMDTPVFGNVNVGLIFGLLQFVSTFGIALAYSRHADRRIDPLADRMRAEIEEAAR